MPFHAAFHRHGSFHKATAMLFLATLSRVFAVCDLPANINMIPVGSAKAISCDTSFPASQIVSMQAIYNFGYPNYDVFLTSGSSCSILPSDSSFRWSIIGGGGLSVFCGIFFLCGRCKKQKSASTTSWETVDTTSGSTPAMAPTSNPLHTSVALKGAAAGMALAALGGAGGLELVSESAVEFEEESQSVLICVCRFVVDFVIGVVRALWNILQSF